MANSHVTTETACKDRLDQFFASYPDSALQKRAANALRFLQAHDKPLAGKPEGWAAGIIYALSNIDRQDRGVPGLLNREFAAFSAVSMGTIRERAARVSERLSI